MHTARPSRIKPGEHAELTTGKPDLRPLFRWGSSKKGPHPTNATLKASFPPTT